MNVIQVSLGELMLLIQLNKSIVVFVTGSWTSTNSHEELKQRIATTGISTIFLLQTTGSDPAEDFIVHTLNVTALPCVCLYTSTQVGYDCRMMDVEEVEAPMWTIWDANSDSSMAGYDFKFSIAHSLQLPALSVISERLLSTKPLVLFVAGDKSSVGKSSICLAIIASLIKLGCPPHLLAYIKPVTQCEAPQPIVGYCSRHDVANVGVGPVVFYKGFTRSYLAGETDSASVLLSSVKRAVDEIGLGKSFVLVDGVGYPAVGSICSLSNADVARTIGAPVLLVGKPGVGDAVDSYNLNATFFSANGVSVLGCIFNKFPSTGFYSLEACASAIDAYFHQYQPFARAYGYIPLLNQPLRNIQSDGKPVMAGLDDSEEAVQLLAEAFLAHVNIDLLFTDLFMIQISQRNQIFKSSKAGPDARPDDARQSIPTVSRRPASEPVASASKGVACSSPAATVVRPTKKRSREDIEIEATAKGAAGG